MRKWLVGVLIVGLLTNSFVFAEGVSLAQAIQGNPRNALEEIKVERAKYNLASAKTAEIDIVGTRKQLAKYGIRLEPAEALQFDLVEFTVYKKAEIGLELSTLGAQLAKNAVELGIRELYLGAYSSQLDVTLKTKKRDLANKKYTIERDKLKRGYATQLSVNEAQLKLQSADLDLLQAKAQLERLQLQLEQLTGKSVTLTAQAAAGKPSTDSQYYKAMLSNRMEVKSLVLQNKMDELVLPYYEKDNRLKIAENQKTYNQLKEGIAKREAESRIAGIKIEEELDRALVDIAATERRLASLKSQLKLLDQQRTKVSNLVKQGLVPAIQLDELAIGRTELENGLKLLQMQYNLKCQKLIFATSIGPAYK